MTAVTPRWQRVAAVHLAPTADRRAVHQEAAVAERATTVTPRRR